MLAAIPLGLKVGAGLLGAGYLGNELKKAGQRKEIDKIVRDSMRDQLGDPTGNFGYQTGFGPGMLLPTSGYQSILQYQNQMGNQQRENMIKNLLAIEPITDRAKTRDFERNMGAARYPYSTWYTAGTNTTRSDGCSSISTKRNDRSNSGISF